MLPLTKKTALRIGLACTGMIGILNTATATEHACDYNVNAAAFDHPSLTFNEAGLVKIKRIINTRIPSATLDAYDSFKVEPLSQLNYTVIMPDIDGEHEGKIILDTPHTKSYKDCKDAANAAYANTLKWIILDDDAYRDNAIKIMDDWAKGFNGYKNNTPWGLSEGLYSGWLMPNWLAPAELLRYWRGGLANWDPVKQARFKVFMDRLKEPIDEHFPVCEEVQKKYPNQALSANIARLCYGIHYNDVDVYTAGGNEIGGFLLHQTAFYASGEVLEVGRKDNGNPNGDPGHAHLDMAGLVQAAEIMWNHGSDLYQMKKSAAETKPMIAKVVEYNSMAFLGGEPYSESLEKYLNRETNNSFSNFSENRKNAFYGFETVYNHYTNRKQPNPDDDIVLNEDVLTLIMARIRPSYYAWNWIGWDTLTHADLGDVRYSKHVSGTNILSNTTFKRKVFGELEPANPVASLHDGTLSSAMKASNVDQRVIVEYEFNSPQTIAYCQGYTFHNESVGVGHWKVNYWDSTNEEWAMLFTATSSKAQYIYNRIDFPDVTTKKIRAVFIPKPGKKVVVNEFNLFTAEY